MTLMIYALQRAAHDMAADIAKYNIIVEPENNMVGRAGRVMKLKDFSTSRECRKAINFYIKLARAEQAAVEQENQASLF